MTKQTVFFIVLASTCSALNGMETAKTAAVLAVMRSSNHTPTYLLPVDDDLRDLLRARRPNLQRMMHATAPISPTIAQQTTHDNITSTAAPALPSQPFSVPLAAPCTNKQISQSNNQPSQPVPNHVPSTAMKRLNAVYGHFQ